MKLALSGVNMSSCLVSYGAEVSGWLTVWSKGKRIYLLIYPPPSCRNMHLRGSYFSLSNTYRPPNLDSGIIFSLEENDMQNTRFKMEFNHFYKGEGGFRDYFIDNLIKTLQNSGCCWWFNGEDRAAAPRANRRRLSMLNAISHALCVHVCGPLLNFGLVTLRL